jgi:hypothetical protein
VSSDEADQCAANLFDLFPSLKPAQVREWAVEFERYDPNDVNAACSEHYREGGDGKGFVRPGRLRDLVKTRMRKRVEGDRVARSREGNDVADEWKLIDATVLNLPKSELDRLTAEVLADPGWTPEARDLLQARGVRASKTLRGAVFARWKTQRPRPTAA